MLEEGEVGAGDALELVKRDPHNVTVSDIYNYFSGDVPSLDMPRRAMRIEHLAEGWRNHFQELLAKIG